MKQIEEQIKWALANHLLNIKDRIATRMNELKRTASGRSASSLSVTLVTNFNAYLEGDSQWNVMQKGRSGGKGPYNFQEIIKDWIQAKGIAVSPRRNETQESALNTAAYLITRSILQKGTALYRYNGYNDIYDSAIEEELAALDKEIGGYFEAEVDNTNSLFIKV